MSHRFAPQRHLHTNLFMLRYRVCAGGVGTGMVDPNIKYVNSVLCSYTDIYIYLSIELHISIMWELV